MERTRFRRGLSRRVRDYRLDDDSLPTGPQTDILGFLDEHIRYEPRRSEANIIARIEATVEDVLDNLFGEAEVALSSLYDSVRVVGDDGQAVEDWSRVDGMDLERTIMTLQRVIVSATDAVGKLYARTLFAQNVKDDEYWEAYRSVIDGTINDRTAAAFRATKDSRYYFFYNYWVWKRAADMLEAYKTLKRDLEFMRSRLMKDPAVVDQVPDTSHRMMDSGIR